MTPSKRVTTNGGNQLPTLVTLPIEQLRLDPKNPRTHPEEQLRRLALSIQRYGFNAPVLVDRERNVLAGHGRLEAARRLGLREVPVVVLGHLDDASGRQYRLADNRLAELSGWDRDLLAAELAELRSDEAALEAVGFTEDDLLDLMAEAGVEVPEPPGPEIQVVPVTRPGDRWALGAHRILCADAALEASYAKLLGDRRVDMVVTSPPYNVGKDYGGACDDSRPLEEYLAGVGAVAERAAARLANGRFLAWIVGVSPRTAPHRHLAILEAAGLAFHRMIVWRKQGIPYPQRHNTVERKRARVYTPDWSHELVLVAGRDVGDREHPCPVCDGSGRLPAPPMAPMTAFELLALFVKERAEEGGRIHPEPRYSSDVWEINQAQASTDLETTAVASERKPGVHGEHTVKSHPAAYPVEVPRALMAFLTGKGETVLDPYLGAGSSLIAAEISGRVAFGIEIEPRFCDVAVRRWEARTGRSAKLVGTKRTFLDVSAERAGM